MHRSCFYILSWGKLELTNITALLMKNARWMFLDGVSKLSVACYNALVPSREEVHRLAEAVEGSKSWSTLTLKTLN